MRHCMLGQTYDHHTRIPVPAQMADSKDTDFTIPLLIIHSFNRAQPLLDLAPQFRWRHVVQRRVAFFKMVRR
jgi:hypothetical protein